METSRFLILGFLFPLFCVSQTLTGRVIDKVTQSPIETVSVYFDNTTVGTTTNEKGEFSISYTNAIQSSLVISYLGYEKVVINNFRNRDSITVELVEANNELDEVLIEYDDGLTRRQKLRLFRKEFLGASKFGKSCKILNENDLILHYDQKDRILYASAKKPLKIENKALQYNVTYDLIDCEIEFNYVNLETGEFSVYKVLYYGTSFYKDLENFQVRKAKRNREKAYRGSRQHFMRALYNKALSEEGYWIIYDKFKVNEWDFFTVETIENSDAKRVTLKDDVSIIFNMDLDLQSEFKLEIDEFFVDKYGNASPILGLYFGGVIGAQRLGNTLPLDYGLEE